MRIPFRPQMWFTAPLEHNARRAELEQASELLDAHPQIIDLVHADLVRDVDPSKGRDGLTAEQTLRVLTLKQTYDYTYEDLEFHLNDSPIYRWYCRLEFERPKKSSFQRAIAKLRPDTLEKISRVVVGYAIAQGIETGRKVRTDCTGVETTIHEPSDSSLLWDCVRVLTRLLGEAAERMPALRFRDHSRSAKRRALAISNARTKERREPLYRNLLKITDKTVGYAQHAARILTSSETLGKKDEKLAESLQRYIELAKRVIDQTRRRVLQNESVPSAEKVVSIFEPHTDIIVKDRRDPVYGHKVCLTAGASGLILDAVVLDGNPADSTLALEMMQRLQGAYGTFPRQATFDGGFSSRSNLEGIKALGIRDVVFSKGRGLAIEEMTTSKRVYKRLRNFRAGIEATISFLKRSFALGRCTWRGLSSFKSYVWSSILSANLLIVARHALNRQ